MNEKNAHVLLFFSLLLNTVGAAGVTLPQRAVYADRFHLVWVPVHSLVISLGFTVILCPMVV